MGKFNRENNFNRGNSDREMYKATCADCGRECEIPFRPTTGRRVYCRDDFKKHSPDEGRGGRDMGRSNNFRSQSRGGGHGMQDRPMFDAVCANCGDKCRVPFEPREGKDTLCSKCFEEKGGDPRRSQSDGNSQQLNEINAKLDKILSMLSSTPASKAKSTPKSQEKKKKKSEEVVIEAEPAESVDAAIEEVPTEDVIPTTPKEKKKKKS